MELVNQYLLNEKLGYNPIIFSYPFGEYSLVQKNYIKEKFKYAFGQHSGVADLTKDIYDNSKAKKLLKWKPKHTLDQGLKITASYYS